MWWVKLLTSKYQKLWSSWLLWIRYLKTLKLTQRSKDKSFRKISWKHILITGNLCFFSVGVHMHPQLRFWAQFKELNCSFCVLAVNGNKYLHVILHIHTEYWSWIDFTQFRFVECHIESDTRWTLVAVASQHMPFANQPLCIEADRLHLRAVTLHWRQNYR